jgi:nicotinamidase-related amidase
VGISETVLALLFGRVMDSLKLDAGKTALVLIDLQNGIVGRATEPYSAAEVMRKGKRLAEAFRTRGAAVVYVRVDMGNFLRLPVDEPVRAPNAAAPPAEASEIAEGAGLGGGDLLITKRHWGAFAGTELEQKLRARGVETVVLGGISTNMGVESTARQGTGLGFAFVVVEDACASSMGTEAHRFAMERIFPRLARVRKTDEVVTGLG